MKRVLVQLTDDQLAAIDRARSHSGRSASAVVREALDQWVAREDRQQRWQRALAAVGGYRSGLHDVSERHDLYLDERAGT